MANHLTKAGAVIYRRGSGQFEFLLVTRKKTSGNGGQWIVPLGTIEAGESPRQAAAREAAEEAGVRIAVGVPLGEHEWTDEVGRPQACRFFLAAFEGGCDWPEQGQRERRWLSPDDAADVVVPAFRPFVLRAADHLDATG